MKSSNQILHGDTLESCLNMVGVPESELLTYLDVRAHIQLTRTNRAIHGLFEAKRLREALLDALMAHLANIIINEPTKKNSEELSKILIIYPELLMRKIKKVVFQQTGQTYHNYSLLQLAFAEGDDELCYLLGSSFECTFSNIDAARKEIGRQLSDKFPEENPDETQETKQDSLAELLTAVIQAFTNEQFNNGIDAENKLILSPMSLAAIATFRGAFEALQLKRIDKGKRFSSHSLKVFYNAYTQAAQQWGHDYKRCALLEDAVLTLISNTTPKNDTLEDCQGFYCLITNKREPLHGRIELTNKTINLNATLRDESEDFSGLFGSCANMVGCRLGVVGARGVEMLYGMYCRHKKTALQNFRNSTQNILSHNL